MKSTEKSSEPGIASAIRSLRDSLDQTQEGMARLIGCTLSGYQKWELGVAVPSGDWLIKMIRLCPDEDCRERFWRHPESEKPAEKPKDERPLRKDGRIRASSKMLKKTGK